MWITFSCMVTGGGGVVLESSSCSSNSLVGVNVNSSQISVSLPLRLSGTRWAILLSAMLLLCNTTLLEAHVANPKNTIVMCDCCLEEVGPLGGTYETYICAKVDIACNILCEVKITCFVVESNQFTTSIQQCTPITLLTQGVCIADRSFAGPSFSRPCGDNAPSINSYECSMPSYGCDPHCPSANEWPGNICSRETRVINTHKQYRNPTI